MLEVGQKLWWVPNRYTRGGKPCEVTVVKVGRKWAELDNWHRIDMATMLADGKGFSAPGRCYVDEDAYLAEQERCRIWQELQRGMTAGTPPDNVTTADIISAAALLKINIGAEK